MTRRCSHCSNNGHNSRTCPTRGGGVKLFGVRLTDGSSSIRKSYSMGNLSSAAALLQSPSSTTASPPSSSDPVHEPNGYVSDDPNHASCSVNRGNDRKKGTPWSEAEHRLFLLGLQKRGKGDWRGISTHFVKSRSPTQVASHAQKYFIRRTNATRRKRRSSLFDMVTDLAIEPPQVPKEPFLLPPPHGAEPENPNPLPSLNLSLNTDFEPIPMEATSSRTIEEPNEPIPSSSLLPPMIPTFFVPATFQIWPTNPEEEHHNHNHRAEPPHHQVLKPIPKLTKEPLKIDVGMSMSQLRITESENNSQTEPLLSLRLPGGSRQSAFRASVPVVATDAADLSKGKSSGVIQAV